MSVTATADFADRVLGLAGRDELAASESKLGIIRQLLLLHLAVQAWQSVWIQTGMPTGQGTLVFMGLIALSATACFGAALAGAFSRWLAPVGLMCALCHIALSLPGSSGHLLLAAFCLFLLVMLDIEKPGQAIDALCALRWTVILVLAWSGLQKLIFGAWTGGEYLSFAIATGKSIGGFFEWAVPAAEVARLKALDPSLTGEGPFRADAPMLVAVSNLIWIAQLVFALGLLHAKTRLPAVVGALALVCFFDVLAARELLMGFLLVSLLLLHAPRPWIESAFWPLVVAWVYALGMGLGLLPGAGWLDGSWVPGRSHL